MIPISALLDSALAILQELGLFALVLVFVAKGALIGKLLPTSVVLPGYVVVTKPTVIEAVGIICLLTLAYLIGQVILLIGTRRGGTAFLDTLPFLDLTADSPALARFERWFDRYGGASIFVTNVIPWTRGLIAIPAGLSRYSVGRYTFLTVSATLVYHGGYVLLPLLGLATYSHWAVW